MKRIPFAVAAYYKRQGDPHRELLLEMRNRILEVVPHAAEIMKYSMPTFVVEGNDIAGLKANKDFVGYYPYSGSVISQFPDISGKYQTTKGSIHIPLGKPLLKSEVKKLVKARLKVGRPA